MPFSSPLGIYLMGGFCEQSQLVHVELVHRLLSRLLRQLHVQNTCKNSHSASQREHAANVVDMIMKFSPTVLSPGRLEFFKLFHQASRGLIVSFFPVVSVVVSSFIVVVVFVVSSVWRIIVVRGRILSLVAIVVVVVVGQLGLSEVGAALQSCKNIFQTKFGLGTVLSKVDRYESWIWENIPRYS